MKRILLPGAMLACMIMAGHVEARGGGGGHAGGGARGGAGHGGIGYGGYGRGVGVGFGLGLYGGYYGGFYGPGYPLGYSGYYLPVSSPYYSQTPYYNPYPPTPYPYYSPDGGLPPNPLVPPMPPADDSAFGSFGPPPAYAPAASPPAPAMVRSNSNMAPAQLVIVVPDAGAQVWVDDTFTRTSGVERTFTTPALERGYSYSYTVRIAWVQAGRQMSAQRDVQVVPGASRTLDFTVPDLPPPLVSQ